MKAKPKKVPPRNVAPTKSLAEEAFSRVPGYFGKGKLSNPSSVASSPDLGEVTNATDIGATKRSQSSAPSSPASCASAPESEQFEGGTEVAKGYR